MDKPTNRPTVRQYLPYEHLIRGENVSLLIRSDQRISEQAKDRAMALLNAVVKHLPQDAL